MNKTDQLTDQKADELYGVLRALNPSANILSTKHSQVPLSEVLNTERFDLDKASQGAGWIKELNEEHVPETE
ncbi:GTP-binding protein, partial [Peribacillus sp. SIMBA_075]